MKIKKGDNVIVMKGKDKGKSGKVVKSFPKLNAVIVENLNIKKAHKRAKRSDKKGEVVSIPAPINVSNLRVVDPKSGKPTKVAKKLIDGKYVRVAKASGMTLDK